MAEEPVNDKKAKREATRKYTRAFKAVESGVNGFLMAEKRYRKEEQRMQMNESLADVAEHMRKKGASEKSIQIALKGAYEILKTRDNAPASTQGTSKQGDAEQAPGLTEEAQGLLLSEVETQDVHWLWEKRIPLGKITILDGDPGMGKSLLAINLAARVSTGQAMPDGSPGMQGSVILIAPEDGAGDTLKPRLEAAEGDPSQVILLNTVPSLDVKKVKIVDRPFSLSDDLDTLERTIKQAKAILVILDPLMAVLGRHIDSSRDQDIREIFTPLAQLAERTGCAILIIRHLNKRSSENLLYRGAGSIGIIAAARIGLIVAQDPFDEQKRMLATTKNNLSKRASNLSYQVVENGRGVPYIKWLGENQHAAEYFITGAKLSAKRQDILRVLKASTVPLSIRQVVESTGQDYTTVRKTLFRMHTAGEIASPSRSLYTALGHPSLIKNVTDTSDFPMEQQGQVSQVSQVSQLSHMETEATVLEQSGMNGEN